MNEHIVIHEGGQIVPIQLSATSERLYEKLLEDPFRVISHEELAAHIGSPVGSLRMQISFLRQRLEEAGIGDAVFTYRSYGYSLRRRKIP